MFLPNHFKSDMFIPRSMITSQTPLDKSRFSLDVSGVAGFFGGEEATSVLTAVHVYRYQRWLGWYNTPGSYQIARKLGSAADATVFRVLFPGTVPYSAQTIAFDGRTGPRFQAVHSGTVFDSTGHLAAVLAQYSATLDATVIEGRKGPDFGVTIVRLDKVPDREVFPPRIDTYSPFFALIPIIVSLAACVASGVYKDWFAFSLILLGVFSNGLSCLVFGHGTLRFTHHTFRFGHSPGDGILGIGREFVLLLGEEGAVNSITRGRFSVDFPDDIPTYLGYCSILLTIQFAAQLLLIPQASLFGQILFVCTLAVSWVYNAWLSTFDKVDVEQFMLLNEILGKPALTRYRLSTRTAAVVFVLCVLEPEDPREILEAYLPNASKVSTRWKETIGERFRGREALRFKEADWDLPGFAEEERRMLRVLYGDAQVGYEGFLANNKTRG